MGYVRNKAMHHVIAFVVLTFLGIVQATCIAGIDSSVNPTATPTGYDFAKYFQRGLTLVEPSLPRMQRANTSMFEHPPSEEALAAATYLSERKLLPSNWSEVVLSPEAWNRAVKELYSWYHIGESPPPWPRTLEQLQEAAEVVFRTVSEALRPVLLIATAPHDDEEILFRALLWNWTVYPRVIVLPPDPAVRASRSNAEAMAAAGNCFINVEHYVKAEESVARTLFLNHFDSQMNIVQTSPPSELTGSVVPSGEELDTLLFTRAGMEHLDSAALTFTGGSAGVFDFLANVSKVKTNIGIFNFSYMFALPF